MHYMAKGVSLMNIVKCPKMPNNNDCSDTLQLFYFSSASSVSPQLFYFAVIKLEAKFNSKR